MGVKLDRNQPNQQNPNAEVAQTSASDACQDPKQALESKAKAGVTENLAGGREKTFNPANGVTAATKDEFSRARDRDGTETISGRHELKLAVDQQNGTTGIGQDGHPEFSGI